MDARYPVLACLLLANGCQGLALRWPAWRREFVWAEQGLTYGLMLWVMALRVGFVDVYGLVCLFGLVSAAHTLRLCGTFVLLMALARMETDGAPGPLVSDDRCLLLWDTRLWLPIHICAWWWTGIVVVILALHHTLYQPSMIMPVEVASMHAFVWGEAALLGGICALHTCALLLSSRIVESPSRFETVFCSASHLRTGEMGIKAHVEDEEGGVILSLTRTERLQMVQPLHSMLDAYAHAAVRTVMVWTLFGPLLMACVHPS